MKTSLRAILATTLILSSAVALHGQSPSVRNYPRTESNSGRQNWEIDMTASGILLFANDNGLLTFDSKEWQTYPISNYSTVRCIHYERERDIIFAGGTNEFGYFAHDRLTGRLRYHSLMDSLPENRRDFGEMWDIFRCDNGNYVFQAKQDVFVMKPDGKFTAFHVPADILCAALSPMGTILASRETIYTIRDMKLQVLPGTESFSGNITLGVLPYGNRLLFATAHNGIFEYDGQHIRPLPLAINGYISDNQLFCAALRGDVLAVGTVRGGIVTTDLKSGRTSYANMATGLQNNTVLSLRFDALGNIWAGLDQGISYVMTEAPYQEILGLRNNYGTGYTTLIDGNRLLMGTNQGLYFIPWPLTSASAPPRPTLVSGMTGQVWSLRDIGNTILCGGNRGAWQVSGTDCRHITGLAGTWDFIPLQGHPDLALCCDYHGLAILEKAGGAWRLRNRLPDFDVTGGFFTQAADGAIWLSQWQQGIYRLRLNDDCTAITDRQLYNRGTGLPTDDNNLVARIGNNIIITAADGFHRFNPAKEATEPDTMLNRLFGRHANRLRLTEGPQGEIMACSSELIALALPDKNGGYKVDSLTFRHLARRLQHMFGKFSFTGTGQVMLNTENGFVLADIDGQAARHTARLLIRRITSTADGDTILYEAPTSAVDTAAGQTPELKVSKRLNSLRIEFILPEFTDERSVSYTCWLEGYDHTWAAVTANEKEYTRLPRGNYVLHVRSFNQADGQTDETAMRIRVQPAWYETWWAYVIYTLLTACAIRLIYRLAHLRYEKKLEEEAQRRRRELKEKETLFENERLRKEREVMQLRNEQQEMQLKHKSSQLADSTMNLIRKNDMLQLLDERMDALSESVRREDAKGEVMKLIREIKHDIVDNLSDDGHWSKFEENFNLVYDNFLSKLAERYTLLKLPDLKLCAYLRMGLSSKEIASLLNTSVRSIETARYRLRKKLELEQGDNLYTFLQEFN